MKERVCSKCNMSKPLTTAYFRAHKRYAEGFERWCTVCHQAATEAWRAAEAKRNPDYHKNNALRKHRLTVETYNAKLEKQGGHCALCPAVTSDNGDRLSVDHNHNCCAGKYSCEKCHRGLLCSTCNSALGYFEAFLKQNAAIANPETWSERALQYLEEYAKETQSTCKA